VADSSFEDSELDSADDSLDSVFSDVSGVLVSASVDELSLCSGVLASVSFSVSLSWFSLVDEASVSFSVSFSWFSFELCSLDSAGDSELSAGDSDDSTGASEDSAGDSDDSFDDGDSAFSDSDSSLPLFSLVGFSLSLLLCSVSGCDCSELSGCDCSELSGCDCSDYSLDSGCLCSDSCYLCSDSCYLCS